MKISNALKLAGKGATISALAVLGFSCLPTGVDPQSPEQTQQRQQEPAAPVGEMDMYWLMRHQEQWVRNDSVFTREDDYLKSKFEFLVKIAVDSNLFIFCGRSQTGPGFICDTVEYRLSSDSIRYYDEENLGHVLSYAGDTLYWTSDPYNEPMEGGRQEVSITNVYISYTGAFPPQQWVE